MDSLSTKFFKHDPYQNYFMQTLVDWLMIKLLRHYCKMPVNNTAKYLYICIESSTVR